MNNNNELRPTLKVQTGEDGNPKVYVQGTPPPSKSPPSARQRLPQSA